MFNVFDYFVIVLIIPTFILFYIFAVIHPGDFLFLYVHLNLFLFLVFIDMLLEMRDDIIDFFGNIKAQIPFSPELYQITEHRPISLFQSSL